MTLWYYIDQGPALYQFLQEARSLTYTDTTEAHARIRAHPLMEVLPHFGLRERPSFHQHGCVWEEDYDFRRLWYAFCHALPAHVQSVGCADGGVVQTLTATAVQDAWEVAQTYQRNCPGLHPWHVALALTTMAYPSWSIQDADTLVRHLPTYPLRVVGERQREPLSIVLKSGLKVPAIGWAYLPAQMSGEKEHELLFLACVGPHKKLKAVWAALMDSKREVHTVRSYTAHYHEPHKIRRMEGRGIYQTFWNDEPLPESGLAHMAIQHISLFTPDTEQPFVHVVGADGVPDLATFQAQFDRASTLPVDPDWVPRMWEAGCDADLIRAVPSHNCTAYWVDTRDTAQWAHIVAACAGATQATIETVGATALETDGPIDDEAGGV